MINSNEVSAMIAQQQQQQQMLGMGAPSPVLGASQYPPQYDFGQNTGLLSHTLSGGNNMMSRMAGATSALGTGLGSAASTAGLLSMFGIGGQTIGGFAGSMLGLNPLSMGLMAAAAPAAYLGGGMVHGNMINNRVGNVLSQAGFANPSAPNGFGFGFVDQTRMSQQLIGMGASNPFVSAEDQAGLLNKFQQMGLDKGIKSIDKMMDKFKDFSKATEDLAISLGKTVGEVTGIVGQLKGQGFFSAAEITGMGNKMAAGANYGMTMQQAMGLASGGASMARGQGMSGSSGALLMTNFSQNLGAAMQLGNVNQNLAMDITGTTNMTDASAALSQRIGGSLMSQFNRGGKLSPLLSGLVKQDDSGNLVIDEQAVAAASSGSLSVDQIKRRGQDTLSDARLKLKFETNQSQLASDLLSSNKGSTAALGMIKNISTKAANVNGTDVEDMYSNIMRNWGIADERTSRLLYDLIDDLEETSTRRMKDEAEYLSSQKRRAYLTRERSFSAYKQKIKHEMSKFTQAPGVAGAFAKASNNWEATLNSLERRMYGLDMPSSAIYTEQNVQDTLLDMASGNLKSQFTAKAGPDSIFGKADMGYRNTIAAAANLDYDKFAQIAQREGGTTKGLTGVDDMLKNFRYHTSDAARNSTIFTTNSGMVAGGAAGAGVLLGGSGLGAMGRGLTAASGRLGGSSLGAALGGYGGKLAGASKALGSLGIYGKIGAAGLALGAMYLGSQSSSDEERIYQNLMQKAKAQGARSEEEAHAMIASTEDGAVALQRHLKEYGAGGGYGFESTKNSYLASTEATRGMSYSSIFGNTLGVIGGIAGGAIAGGSTLGGAAILGSIGGTIAGEAIGRGIGGAIDMFTGDAALSEQSKTLSGAKLLAKFKSKKDLKNFDKVYKDALAKSGDDPNKAYTIAADTLKKMYGEDITGTDVQTALFDLKGATGMDVGERVTSGKYDKAFSLAKQADSVIKSSIAQEHMSELGAALTGEDDPYLTAIREAAMSGDSGAMSMAMRDAAKAAQRGDFTYSGDNETVLALTKDNTKQLEKYAGRGVEALDEIFGKGVGMKMRNAAGIVRGKDSLLTKRELREIASMQSTMESLGTLSGKASQGLASIGATGEGDTERLATATKNLVRSTDDLATFVDALVAHHKGTEPLRGDFNLAPKKED